MISGLARLWKHFFQAVFVALVVMVLPCFIYWFHTENSRGIYPEKGNSVNNVNILVNQQSVNVENFLILMISVDYQPEMEEEALKAFAVAARSSLYAHLRKYRNEDSVEAQNLQVAYYEPGEMVGALEEAAESEGVKHWSTVYKRIKQAVEETAGICLTYDAERNEETKSAETPDTTGADMVDALWHVNSAGNTRFYAGNLSGEDDGISLYSPELKAMDGKDGMLPEAVTMTIYTRRQLAELLWEVPGTEEILTESRTLDAYFQIESRDSSGYIEKITIGEQEMTGDEAAQLLQIPSACFFISQVSDSGNNILQENDSRENDSKTGDSQEAGDLLKIVVYGTGRGYGLSLSGASVLASQGADYEEILEYYFPVCELNNFPGFWTE